MASDSRRGGSETASVSKTGGSEMASVSKRGESETASVSRRGGSNIFGSKLGNDLILWSCKSPHKELSNYHIGEKNKDSLVEKL